MDGKERRGTDDKRCEKEGTATMLMLVSFKHEAQSDNNDMWQVEKA